MFPRVAWPCGQILLCVTLSQARAAAMSRSGILTRILSATLTRTGESVTHARLDFYV